MVSGFPKAGRLDGLFSEEKRMATMNHTCTISTAPITISTSRSNFRNRSKSNSTQRVAKHRAIAKLAHCVESEAIKAIRQLRIPLDDIKEVVRLRIQLDQIDKILGTPNLHRQIEFGLRTQAQKIW